MAFARDSSNLKDLESKISALERINFDLKMQLFYLNENKLKKGVSKNTNRSNVRCDSEDDEDDDDESDKNIEVLILQGEVESLKRKLEDIESENQSLRISRDKEAEKYQRIMKSKPIASAALLEENHKREREAARAIAEHDAAFIQKLQQEISKLQEQSEKDKTIIKELHLKLAEKGSLLRDKEEALTQLTTFNASMKQQLEMLTEKSKYHELVLRSNGWSNISLPSSEIKSSDCRTVLQNDMDETEKLRRRRDEEAMERLRNENKFLFKQIDTLKNELALAEGKVAEQAKLRDEINSLR